MNNSVFCTPYQIVIKLEAVIRPRVLIKIEFAAVSFGANVGESFGAHEPILLQERQRYRAESFLPPGQRSPERFDRYVRHTTL